MFSRVCVFGTENEVFNGGWVNLLILRRDQESSHAEQLEILFFYRFLTQVPVNQVYSYEECLGQQLVLLVESEDPVHQHTAVVLDYAAHLLDTHVAGVGLALHLRPLHVLLDFGAVLGHVIDICQGQTVDLGYVRGYGALFALLSELLDACHFFHLRHSVAPRYRCR